ncbi:hypothetical protein AVEN_11005-1 [Araneus ventricosus]|uniref:Uncharacterized protein n=2 Tax=Araneus ventricosus TaxID=182803 RepID=A0A4Y2RVL0_ARAVE|nr:hypothetical protein AVEN_762-1 [Araneus ventricosus]GBN79015.1 hypothetical protein AVEN_6838-1 [Araneus ventricosus]GBN79019.1 hypothetical protein AVEN_11005-1 [Araneus ventricosus]
MLRGVVRIDPAGGSTSGALSDSIDCFPGRILPLYIESPGLSKVPLPVSGTDAILIGTARGLAGKTFLSTCLLDPTVYPSDKFDSDYVREK